MLMGIGGWNAMHVEIDAEIDTLEANAKAVQSIKNETARESALNQTLGRIETATEFGGRCPWARVYTGFRHAPLVPLNDETGYAAIGSRCAQPQAHPC